jgi:hypothetical protein
MPASIVDTTASSIVDAKTVGSGAKSRATTISSYWKPLPFLSTARQDAACTIVDLSATTQAVVIVGGRNTQAPSLDQVELLEWNVQRRWWPLPSTQTARCGCALVAFGRRLYVVGGISADSQPQSTMETFEVKGPVNEWTTVSEPMAAPRMYPGAVAFGEGPQQVILVVGGRDQTWQELDSCELYTVETGKWEGVLSMETPRFGCGLVYLESLRSVLALGGYNGSEWTTSCELYNPDEDNWTESPSMPRAVQFCSATVLTGPENEEYVVVRGQPMAKETHDVSTVGLSQCYNISTKEWIILPAMSDAIGAAVATIDQSRLLVLGGGFGEDLEAASTCRFWMTNISNFFAGDADAASLGDSSVPQPPMLIGQQPAEDTERGEDDLGDEESTVHPFLYAPRSGASVASASTNFTATTNFTSTSRRKVENETIMDNIGVQVKFTGFLASETGRPHGKGRMTWPLTGDRYEGRFEHGARQGRGHMMYKNDDSFLGFFHGDQREGKGEYQYRDGRTYEGNYVNDMTEDPQGKMRWRDGTMYTGQFVKGKRTGKGKIIFAKANVEYEGDFVNGKYHGKGFCRFADGSVYRGQWKHGKAHGKGKLTDSQGRVVHDGKWVDDGPVYK